MEYDTTEKMWSDDGCLTSLDYVTTGYVTCQCNLVQGSFIGLFTDAQRIKNETFDPATIAPIEVEVRSDPTEMATTVVVEEVSEASKIIFVAGMLTLLVGIYMIAIILDKKDFKSAQLPNLIVSESVINVVAKKTADHEGIVGLRKKEFARYLEVPLLTNSALYSFVKFDYNPLIGIFTRYDVDESRISRLIMFVFQLSLVQLVQYAVLSSINVSIPAIVGLSITGAFLMTLITSVCRITWLNNRRVFKREDTQMQSEKSDNSCKDDIFDDSRKNSQITEF